MPPPERMLPTLRRAIDAVRATPGRSGHLVRLPAAATEVVVAGDLHGHLENFRFVLTTAALAAHPARHLVLQEVVHGPFRYPDGGDKSHQLLDLFAALKCQHPGRVHLLPGNHEMAQWAGRSIGKGDSGESLNDAFRKGVRFAYGDAWGDIYKLYIELLRACPLAVRTANAVCVSHSLPAARHLGAFDAAVLERDDFPDAEFQPGGSVYALLWGRDTADENVAGYLRKMDADLLVSGHIPTDAGFATPNRRQLIVDCSARPAAVVVFPADRPLTLADLVAGVKTV